MAQTSFDKSTNEDTTIPDALKWLWNNPKKVGMTALEMTPIVGDAIAAKEIFNELQKADPNYYLIGALGGATLIGIIPGLGDAVSATIKAGAKKAVDIAKRVEVDPNTLGMNFGNVSIRPRTQKEEFVKLVQDQKNKDDYVWVTHGGKNFDGPLNLQKAGTGEPLSLRPLGMGIYGTLLDPNNTTSIKDAFEHAHHFAAKFGPFRTYTFEDPYPNSTARIFETFQKGGDSEKVYDKFWKGYSDPLYEKAFSPNISTEDSIELLQKVYSKYPERILLEEWHSGGIHLLKIKKDKIKRINTKGHESYRSKTYENKWIGAKQLDDLVSSLPNLQDSKADYGKTSWYSDAELRNLRERGFDDTKAQFVTELLGSADRPYIEVAMLDPSIVERVAKYEPWGISDKWKYDPDKIYLPKSAKEIDDFRGGTFPENTWNQVPKQTRVFEEFKISSIPSSEQYYINKRPLGSWEKILTPEETILQYPKEKESVEFLFQEQRKKESLELDNRLREQKRINEATEKLEKNYPSGAGTDTEEMQLKALGKATDGIEYLRQNIGPTTWTPKSKPFNKGGLNMNTQTEMAFMQEGGLRDDGATNDPVSGNEVPSGSMDQEVRDDIPARLSEGEYVVPADVVRYFGVKFFEDLRAEAKRGLTTMEQDGRIGGEPVSPSKPMPPEGQEDEDDNEDDFPFDISELRTRQVNVGGLMTGYKNGGNVIKAGTALSDAAEIADEEVQQSAIKYLKYTNGSNIIYIRFMGGQPLDVIPMGYLPMEGQTVPDPTVPEEPVEEKEEEETTQEKAEERFGTDDSEVKPYRQLRDTPYDPKEKGSARGVGVTGDLDYMPTGFQDFTSQDFIDAGESYNNSLAKIASFIPGGDLVASMTSSAGRAQANKILNDPSMKASDRIAAEIFKLQTDKIPEANFSDLIKNPFEAFMGIFTPSDSDNLADTATDNKIKELTTDYLNAIKAEKAEFNKNFQFKGTDYAARDFYNLGSMELQGLGTDGEQSGRVFYQPSNMGRANDKFRYNIGGFQNIYVSRKELNEYFGFPPNHDLTPEQIASFDPLLAEKRNLGKGLLGEDKTKYVPPSKPVEAGTLTNKQAKVAVQQAQAKKDAIDAKKPVDAKPVFQKADKKTKDFYKKLNIDAPIFIDKTKEKKKKDIGADLSAGKGGTGYKGGRATGGLVSRRKSKKKT